MICARDQQVSGESQPADIGELGTFDARLGHEPGEQQSSRKRGKVGRREKSRRSQHAERGTSRAEMGHPPKKKVMIRDSRKDPEMLAQQRWVESMCRALVQDSERKSAPKPRRNSETWVDFEAFSRQIAQEKQAQAAAAEAAKQAESWKTQTCETPEHEPCETPVNLDELSPQLLDEKKNLALTAILCGQTYTDVAKAAGVDRRTIHRWRQEPEFQAELQRVKGVMGTSLRIRLAALTDDAVEAIKERMDRGHVPTAINLLQSVGVLDGRSLTEVDGLDGEQMPDPVVTFSTPEQSVGVADSVQSPPAEEVVDLCDLPVNQQKAIGALLEGKMLVEAAGKASVTLRTLQRWIRTEGAFRQVLRNFRQEQIERTRIKLMNHCLLAVDLMVLAVKYNHNATASFAVLRGLGLMK